MTPTAVGKSIPQLQFTAQEKANQMLSKNAIRMADVCTEFTLDVAWRKILGLQLSQDEIPVFRQAVMDWAGGIASIPAILGIGIRFTKGYKARLYLEGLIEQRMEALKCSGPDTSTLSGMVFATDEDPDGDQEKRKVQLTKREVIDNAMVLILAGSETAALTLSNAFLCLGLQPEKWQRLIDEQNQLQELFGTELNKEILDGSHCPYLEAVVKETMRIRPLAAGIPRKTKATTIVDGVDGLSIGVQS
jgi:cytochrome P450